MAHSNMAFTFFKFDPLMATTSCNLCLYMCPVTPTMYYTASGLSITMLCLPCGRSNVGGCLINHPFSVGGTGRVGRLGMIIWNPGNHGWLSLTCLTYTSQVYHTISNQFDRRLISYLIHFAACMPSITNVLLNRLPRKCALVQIKCNCSLQSIC